VKNVCEKLDRVCYANAFSLHLENISVFETLTQNTSDWVVVLDGHNHDRLFSNKKPEIALTDIAFEEIINAWMIQQIKNKYRNANIKADFNHNKIAQSFIVNMFNIKWLANDAVLFLFTDISRTREKQIEDLAYRDQLTKVCSRYFGMMTLEKSIQSNTRFVLCFIDIDKLKYVNDNYGHILGDQYILKVANTIKEFSDEAIVSRIGGDEFLILDSSFSIDEAKDRLAILLKNLEYNQCSDRSCVKYSFSYGVIERQIDDISTVEELLRRVDQQMYALKDSKKNLSERIQLDNT
jgi:diguanylate cyclase (GGDEF)-like protein